MTELIVYTTSLFHCPFCEKVKQVLRDHSYAYIERDTARKEIREELSKKRPSAKTVPQIFLPDGTYIGNCDETVSLIENGRIDFLIGLCEPAEPLKADDPVDSDGSCAAKMQPVPLAQNSMYMPEQDLRSLISRIWGGFPQHQRTPDHVMQVLERIYPDQYDEQRARELASQIG